jgi:parvulin-like peptidyl-prolyl isomerase
MDHDFAQNIRAAVKTAPSMAKCEKGTWENGLIILGNPGNDIGSSPDAGPGKKKAGCPKVAMVIIPPNQPCMKLPLPVCVALWLLAEATGLPAPTEGGGTTNDPVEARGRGFEIRRSDMDQVLKSITVNDPGDRLPPDAEIHVLNQLIELQLVWQKATAEERAAGEQAADQTLASARKKLSAAEFEHRLQAAGLTTNSLRRKLAQESTGQLSLTRQLGIQVTDAQVRDYYAANPGMAEQPERARVRELLLMATRENSGGPLPPDTVAAKHRQIFELYQRLRAGEDFAGLARQFNEDPESKANAGELPPFQASKKEFGDRAFAMKTNQISDVLTNSDGYRIFQLLELIPAKKIALADLADSIKRGLIGAEKRRRAPAYLEQLRKEAGVEILDDRLKSLMSPP